MIFNDSTQSEIAERQRAELYMRIYKYAAEDFPSIPDINNYSNTISSWANSIENKLTSLGQKLSSHTHPIPPHTHIAPTYGGPVSPTPLTSSVASNASTLIWTLGVPPTMPANTTLTTPNLTGNSVIYSPGFDDVTPSLMRAKVIPILMRPSLPPILTGGAV